MLWIGRGEATLCPRVTDLPRGQQGAALVVAMLVFALVAPMVGLQRDFTLTLQRGTHQLFSSKPGPI